MADSATAKKMARPGAAVARRYGLAFVSVTGALLLELLFHHFNLPHPLIDNNTLALCQSYPWPGNIRELQNIVERSVILCGGDTFWIDQTWLACVQPPRPEVAGPLPDALQNQEKEMIEAALAESNGKVAGPEGAAAKLGIPRSTLDSKIKQLKIKKHKFTAES
jgi:formate hydrogenlyase transcriptional activator